MARPMTEGEMLFENAMRDVDWNNKPKPDRNVDREVNEAIARNVPSRCPFCKSEGTVRLSWFREPYLHGAGLYGFASDSYHCGHCGRTF